MWRDGGGGDAGEEVSLDEDHCVGGEDVTGDEG